MLITFPFEEISKRVLYLVLCRIFVVALGGDFE